MGGDHQGKTQKNEELSRAASNVAQISAKKITTGKPISLGPYPRIVDTKSHPPKWSHMEEG